MYAVTMDAIKGKKLHCTERSNFNQSLFGLDSRVKAATIIISTLTARLRTTSAPSAQKLLKRAFS